MPRSRLGRLHLPHKTICKNIQHVRAATLLGEDAAWNRTVHGGELHRSPVKFAEACMAGSVDPRIAEAVWQEIASLQRKSRKRWARTTRTRMGEKASRWIQLSSISITSVICRLTPIRSV
jgi:hypothetical protein